MAEGDTLRRAKLRLAPILESEPVVEFWARKIQGNRPRVGHTISSVRSVGKHMLFEFSNGLTLETHLGMNGSWRAFPGQQLAPADKVRFDPYLKVIIATSKGYALCFRAPKVKTFIAGKGISPEDRLGPDLCDKGIAFDAVVHKARTCPSSTTLAELLMEQSVASGIGNIYKSESLHIQKLYPYLALSDVDDQQLLELYAKASELLRRNIRHGKQRRTITPDGGFFVYERFRAPCKRCQTPIKRAYKGKFERSTYWCPTCQPSQ